jgi:alanine racemase
MGVERNAEAVIDLAALRDNVRELARRAAPAGVMLAVKANAYGHGLVPVAKTGVEAGATALGVLEIPAALELRAHGIAVPLFAWLHGADTDWRSGVEADVELGISARWQLDAIAASDADRPAVVHLKLDTGLSRNGATLEEWPDLVDAALAAERAGTVRIHGVWSHLADASPADDHEALDLFLEGVGIAERRGARFEVRHLAASSAGIRLPEARFDFVRFGIAAYGISPFDDVDGAGLGLRPVMSLRAPVLDVDERTARARIAAGFGDGVHSTGIGRTAVSIGGRRHPVVAVDPDSTVVDVSGSTVRAGDTATFFGPGDDGEPTAEEWAQWCDTVGDEIVTHVAPRVPRHYLG